MKYEVEVKARVKDFREIKKRLAKMGCKFGKPIVQHDFVFYKDGLLKNNRGTNPVLRIRKQADATYFTMKLDRSNDLDCIEKETRVENGDAIIELLPYIGYKKVMEIKKKRTKAKFKSMEICLDEVDKLGTFVELELITSRDANIVQEELFQFLESLGVSRKDRVTFGYDSLTIKAGFAKEKNK